MSNLAKHCLYVSAAVVVAAFPIAWRFAVIHYKVHAASNPQPATIQQHTEVTGPTAGNAAILEVRTIALRSDGSRADVTREPRKGWVMRRLSFSNGIMQTVYDDVQTVSTSQMSGVEMQNRWKASPDPAANCATSINGIHQPHPSTVLGTDSRFGVPVVKVLNGSDLTVWMAPSLGCVILEHSVDWEPSHPGTNKSELKVDSITRGEPDSSLFRVPSTYTEMPPSQAKALHLRFAHVPDSAVQKLSAQAATNEDPFYLSHRPTASGKL